MKLTAYILRGCITTIILLSTVQFINAQPVINSLSPYTGGVGSNVIINGTGFNSTGSLNTVWFGSSKATVNSATTNSLNVTVPTGFRPGPLSMTTGGLSATSTNHYLVTFPGGGPFVSGSFLPYTSLATPVPYSIVAADVNGDNKPELITANYATANVSVHTNASTANGFNFSTRNDFAIGSTGGDVTTADIDGDGRLDIIATGIEYPDYRVSVLRNTSTGGSVSFAGKVDYITADRAYTVATGDLDGDGKPDIIVTNGNNIITFKNNSTIGNVSFDSGVTWAAGQYPAGLAIVDLNEDGKPEVCMALGSGQAGVMPNNSVPGTISLGTTLTFSAGASPVDIAAGDLTGDGKPDLAVMNYGSSSISIFKNTTTGATITMNTPLNLSNGPQPWDVELADVNGDGLLDVVGSVYSVAKRVSIFRNTTSGGTLSFAARADYATASDAWRVAIADLRNTGRLDMAVAHSSTGSLSLFQNKISEPPVVSSFSPTSGGEGTVVNINGQNLSGVTAVTFGGVAVASFNIISDNLITVNGGVGATGAVTVTGPSGVGSLGGYVFIGRPKVTSINPVAAPAGQVITINGTDFSTNAADNIVYFGGSKATVINATPTQLLVTVPTGAMYAPISVTKGGQTSYSSQHFDLLFADGNLSSTTLKKSFSTNQTFNVGLENAALADIDRDGRTDIITSNYSLNSVSVYPNTSQNGIVSFGPPVNIPTGGQHPVGVTIADFDGDGKLDIAAPCEWSSLVSLLKNNSTAGSFSFAAPYYFITGAYPNHVAVGDLDGDGRPDLAVASNGATYIAVGRNTSSGSGIAFNTQQFFYVQGYNTFCTAIDDIDGDGKPDILGTNQDDSSFVFFRNTSVPGSITSAPPITYDIGKPGNYITTADLDKDGKKDIIISSGVYCHAFYSDTSIMILRNTSTPGNLSIGARTEVYMKYNWKVNIADMDGDGWGDIVGSATADNSTYTTALFKNTSSVGSISFGPRLENVSDPVNYPNGFDVGDLDGDGIPDVGMIYPYTETVGAQINQNGPLREFCPSGANTIYSNISGSNYQWQVMRPDSASFRNLYPDGIHSNVNSQALTITNLPSNWTGSKYRCVVNTGTSKVFTVKIVNRWTGAINNNWENPGNWSCNTVPDANTAVVISSGTVVVNASTTIYSLMLSPGVSFTVATGVVLTISH